MHDISRPCVYAQGQLPGSNSFRTTIRKFWMRISTASTWAPSSRCCWRWCSWRHGAEAGLRSPGIADEGGAQVVSKAQLLLEKMKLGGGSTPETSNRHVKPLLDRAASSSAKPCPVFRAGVFEYFRKHKEYEDYRYRKRCSTRPTAEQADVFETILIERFEASPI